MEEPVEVDLSSLQLSAARLEAADVEQPLHKPRESLRLFAEGRADLALFRIELAVDVLLQQLEVTHDHVDRRLELMRRDRDELSLELVEIRELRSHAVIACGKPAEFVGTLFHRGQTLSEIAVGNGFHSAFQVEHGPADRTR